MIEDLKRRCNRVSCLRRNSPESFQGLVKVSFDSGDALPASVREPRRAGAGPLVEGLPDEWTRPECCGCVSVAKKQTLGTMSVIDDKENNGLQE